MSLIGVTGWHQHPEWAQIDLTGRAVLIGFDGDVRSNWNVWTQADKLWRHLTAAGATPALLDIADDVPDSASRARRRGRLPRRRRRLPVADAPAR